MIQIPIEAPQPSSSCQEDPMQVNATPRDEEDARTVRPRLDMSALIVKLCDAPEIDWRNSA